MAGTCHGKGEGSATEVGWAISLTPARASQVFAPCLSPPHKTTSSEMTSSGLFSESLSKSLKVYILRGIFSGISLQGIWPTNYRQGCITKSKYFGYPPLFLIQRRGRWYWFWCRPVVLVSKRKLNFFSSVQVSAIITYQEKASDCGQNKMHRQPV